MSIIKDPASNRNKRNKLPIWAVIAGFGLLLVAAIAIWFTVKSPKAKIEVAGAPAIRVEQDVYDYGEVKNGVAPITTVVKVTNVGDQTLRFTEAPFIELKEGCCPPIPAINAMELRPGQSTTVTLEFLMHGQMGGPHDFRLHLLTNDPVQPDKVVSVLSNWVD